MTYNQKIPPFKWFILENFPYIEEDFDALTNWQLFCKLGKEMNKIIEKTNLTGEQVEQLTTAFNELKEYIDNYFENLDVQEEINTKLDEMAESGELAEIIAQFLNTNVVFAFDSISDLKLAENLVDGSFVQTYGYYNINDGGCAKYKVRQVTNQDVPDDMFVIALHDTNLVAELVIENNRINVKQMGMKGDNQTDETEKFQHIIDTVPNGTTIYVPIGQYILSDKITMPNMSTKYVVLEGQNRDSSQLLFNIDDDSVDCAIEMVGTGIQVLNKCIIKHLKINNIKENDISNTDGIHINNTYQINCLEDLSLDGFYNNIDLGNSNWSFTLKNIRSSGCRNDGIHGHGTLNNIHLVGCDIMYSKNANIFLQGAMNCSIENTDFSVYNNGLYGIYMNFCNGININNCYYESAEDCTVILAGIYAETVDGLTINSIDVSKNAVRQGYKTIHIKNSHASVIDGFNIKSTSSSQTDYGIYYENSHNNELGACYFNNVNTCVYVDNSTVLFNSMHIYTLNVTNTIVGTASAILSGTIRNDIYERSSIHDSAKPYSHLIGANALTRGTTAQRPHVFSIGQIYFDTTLNKYIFGRIMPTFQNQQVVSGDTWADANGSNV